MKLGCFIAGAARVGRNKLTLIASPEVAALGSWIEQLVAESTGKRDRGIVPIDQEPLCSPEEYSNDRAFVYLRFGGKTRIELDSHVDAIVAQGHPVARVGLFDLRDLGGEFYRWEIATAAAGALLNVNPFDEPNVREAKEATARVLEGHASASARDRTDLAQAGERIGALLDAAGGGDYVALSAFFENTVKRGAALDALRAALRTRSGRPTTLGIGPRFLHSTGQLHKGGPNTGIFVVLTEGGTTLPVPDAPYDFRALQTAQALGDIEALAARQRRLVHVHLGDTVDAGLEELTRRVRG